VHAEIFEGTLNSAAEFVPALEGVSTIYHVAAGTSGSAADLFLSSVVASRNLLEAVRLAVGETGEWPRIVLVSSFSVYGVAHLKRGTLIDEEAPLETQPENRDNYGFAKLRQERLFWEYREKRPFPLVVLRPGVIYGPGGSPFSARVGLSLGGLFLHLGGSNLLPLTYVENCAEAIVVAGQNPQTDGQVYNVVDDDLVTSRQYLNLYKKNVRRVRSIFIPYFATQWLSKRVERYHIKSKGQLPAVFTPYKVASNWKGMRFDNSKLKSIGWKPVVQTSEALKRTFEYLRANPK
jgi:2-alkyl-3-oxoalkanoate reductase